MKPLALETNDTASAELVMDTVQMVTRMVKHEMRKHRPAELSMPQFRALGVVKRHPDTSVSVVAGHLGLTKATASKLIDSLVKQGLLTRVDSPEDRRVVVINLTDAGETALNTARSAALGHLAEILASLDEKDRAAVVHAMDILREALS